MEVGSTSAPRGAGYVLFAATLLTVYGEHFD
jgi:hypothetical protein